jgi:hypothetical protein
MSVKDTSVCTRHLRQSSWIVVTPSTSRLENQNDKKKSRRKPGGSKCETGRCQSPKKMVDVDAPLIVDKPQLDLPLDISMASGRTILVSNNYYPTLQPVLS